MRPAKTTPSLAHYERYQFEQNIKPDYSNVGGLEMFDGKEWEDWYDHEADELREWITDRAPVERV